MSTGDPPDFPLGKESTQSPAQQDMDRKLQALTAEHEAQMQALTEANEARRLLILKGESDPALSTPEKSAGSSSTAQGAEPAGPPRSYGKAAPPP